jgi:predicted nucleotidyltransferase
VNTIRREAIEELRRMVPAALGEHDAAVWLFGSCARGEPQQHGDIDIAVQPRAELPLGFFGELQADIEESTIPYEVDLVDLLHADPALIDEIRREGVPWREVDRRLTEARAALATLDEVAGKAVRSLIERDGAILRLIYTFEAVWTACQRLSGGAASPNARRVGSAAFRTRTHEPRWPSAMSHEKTGSAVAEFRSVSDRLGLPRIFRHGRA